MINAFNNRNNNNIVHFVFNLHRWWSILPFLGSHLIHNVDGRKPPSQRCPNLWTKPSKEYLSARAKPRFYNNFSNLMSIISVIATIKVISISLS